MTEQIFDKSAGIILDIKLWSGSKNLRAEDLQGSELPPEELVSLGSKRIHDKETLKALQAVRTKAVTALESVAVSLYSGKVWLIPADKLDDVTYTLETLLTEFEAEKTEFLQCFYASQQTWLEKNSQWASILEPYLETPESVDKKFAFTWRTFRINPAQNDNLADSIASDTTHTLLKEVSTLAAEAYETLKDRDRATNKNLNRLDRLASKLRGMSFVDPGVGMIEQEMRQILNMRDADGVLTGPDVYHLARLLVQLKNPAVLEEVLDAARDGQQYRFAYDVPQAGGDANAPVPQKPKSINQPRLPDAWF